MALAIATHRTVWAVIVHETFDALIPSTICALAAIDVIQAFHTPPAVQADTLSPAAPVTAADAIPTIIVRSTVATAMVQEAIRTVAAIVVLATLDASSAAAEALSAIVITAAFLTNAVATDLACPATVAIATNTIAAVSVRCATIDTYGDDANFAFTAIVIPFAIDTLRVPSAYLAVGTMTVVTTPRTVAATTERPVCAAFEAAIFSFVTGAIAADGTG